MKHLKKPILYILTAALCASLLAGCGGKNNPADPSAPGNTPAQTEEHPDYVYTTEYVPVKADLISSFDNALYSNGKLLVSSYGKIGERELEEGEILEYEEQLWIYGEKLYWLSLDGTLEEITGYAPMEVPEDMEIPEDANEANANSYMQRMLLDENGDIITLESCYVTWFDDPGDLEMYSEEWWNAGYYDLYYHSEERYYLRHLAPDGSEISCASLDTLKKATEGLDYFYVNNMVIGPDNKLYLSGDMCVFVCDMDGNLLGAVDTQGNYVDSILALPDCVAVGYWGEEGEMLAPIDPETLTLGAGVHCSNVYNAVVAPEGSDYDFYYTDGSNFMGYSLAAGESTKILNWINCDIDNTNQGRTVMLPDGRILTMLGEYNDDYTKCNNQLVFLSKVPYDSVEHKQTLTLATQYLGYEARSAIIKFNRNNPTYRIELKDYSEYNTEEDYSAGLTKLTTEILAGNVPDIIDLGGLPLEQFAGKGLLADLYPLLESDSELSRDAIFPSVLTALEQDGHLYRTASSFGINTVVGAASIVGDTPGWTLADFKAALAQMPEGCTPFDESMTRDIIMQQMLAMEMDNLIDWNTGKCYFDSPAFRDILEFSAQFPEIYEWPEDYVWTEEDDAPNRIASGKQMLMRMTLSDFESYQMYSAMFGGDATFIGYPVSEGVGNALTLDGSGYAISSKCAVPEAAWQFVREFFTESYQTKNVWSFPTNRAAFDKKLEEAMTPQYEKDINGNFVLDENGEKIEVSRGGWGWGSLYIDIHSLTQAEADEILDVINSTTRVLDYGSMESNNELMSIIMSDTEAYFLGQKPLDEIVRLLQSKLNIYINEQR